MPTWDLDMVVERPVRVQLKDRYTAATEYDLLCQFRAAAPAMIKRQLGWKWMFAKGRVMAVLNGSLRDLMRMIGEWWNGDHQPPRTFAVDTECGDAVKFVAAAERLGILTRRG